MALITLIHTHTVCDNITILYRFYETKQKRNNLFRCTKHPTRLDSSKTIHRWIKRWRTIRALLLLLLRWDIPMPTGDASLYSAGESTGNRHWLWMSSPEQRDTWGLSSGSWCGHGVKVEHATEPRSFHRRPSTSAFTAAVIFVGRHELGLLSMLFVSLCFCRNLYPHSVSYQALLS